MAYTPSTAPGMKQGKLMTQRPQFQQFQTPNYTQTEQLAEQRMNDVLQQGGSLSPDVVAKLKARQKESALNMAGQQQQQAKQALAQKGWSPAGGTMQAANNQVNMNAINSILAGNRDIDINAATQNRQDILNALAASDAFMGNKQARAGDTFRNILAGQGAQADSDFRVDSFNEDARRYDSDFGLKAWLANEQAQQAADDSKLRTASLLQGINQDMLNFGENQRQFNNTLGFQYDRANAQDQNSLMSYLMSIFG